MHTTVNDTLPSLLPESSDLTRAHRPHDGGMASRRRCVCVCVDDFGLHGGINAAVLDLSQRKRIGATGCMVDGPAWAQGAAALRELPASLLDVGLHFDLTEARLAPQRTSAISPASPANGALQAGSKLPLRHIIIASYRQQLDSDWLAAEVTRQLDAFEAAMQRPPAFVDGHQHVHQLPQVREALLAELQRRYPAQEASPGSTASITANGATSGITSGATNPARPWLRCTRPALRGLKAASAGAANAFKASVIGCLGAAELARQAQAAGFAMSRALSGVYGFDGSAARYQRLLALWLQHSQHGDVLMCHPSASVVEGDAIASARCIEYQVLAAESFEQIMQQANVHIAPHSSGGALPLPA